MKNKMIIKVADEDNVAIAIHELEPNTQVLEGVITTSKIPQGHKIALKDIKKGEPIIRYNVILGYAKSDINQGDWINEFMVELPIAPSLDDMVFNTKKSYPLPIPPRTTFFGYDSDVSRFAGTRNILAIHTSVQCVTGILNIAVDKIKKEILPKYPFVDDVVPINHAYGCGVAINAREAHIPIRMLKNLIKNPNFGGEIMMVGLGCEKLTYQMLLDDKDINPDNIITLQEKKGFDDMIESICQMAETKLKKLNTRRRTELPLSKLCIGMQCGGSDAFSGVTGNPSAGYAADLLVSAGGSVMFSETTEVRDGVHIIAQRCESSEVGQKLASEMRWYDQYLSEGDVDRSANPTPGNKKGGLSNIVEKAMGSIAKSGSSQIVEVLSPGAIPLKNGLIYAATPASDFVCGSCQLSSGATLQVFVTGRGTPYGLAAAPVIKVSTRNNLKNFWQDLIDINAGPIAEGEATIEEIGIQLFNEIVDIASGNKQSYAEKYKLHNDFCVFNPAPIT